MENLLLNNLNKKKTSQVPIWLMRQAGRYMKEYHDIKKKFSSFMEMCKNEEAISEITLQPIKKFDFDAAIIFSDILVILDALNIDVQFKSGEGPIIKTPNKDNLIEEIKKELNYAKLQPCYNAIKNIKKTLITKPLIGFSAAPWTLACYYIEGKITKDLKIIKKYSYQEIKKTDILIELLTDHIIDHLKNQIKAGVDAVQIFDTHAFHMDYKLHEKYSVNMLKKISTELKLKYPNIPIIFYTKSNLMKYYNEIGLYVNCLSLNSNIDLAKETNIINNNICIQGNLDPVLLTVGGKEMIDTANKILTAMTERPFIFNLGHGVLPDTPIKNVYDLIDCVKKFNS